MSTHNLNVCYYGEIRKYFSGYSSYLELLSYKTVQIKLIPKCQFDHGSHCWSFSYDKCPKILNTIVSDEMTCANSADPDQNAQEQSNQGLHYLLFHYIFKETAA